MAPPSREADAVPRGGGGREAETVADVVAEEATPVDAVVEEAPPLIEDEAPEAVEVAPTRAQRRGIVPFNERLDATAAAVKRHAGRKAKQEVIAEELEAKKD